MKWRGEVLPLYQTETPIEGYILTWRNNYRAYWSFCGFYWDWTLEIRIIWNRKAKTSWPNTPNNVQMCIWVRYEFWLDPVPWRSIPCHTVQSITLRLKRTENKSLFCFGNFHLQRCKIQIFINNILTGIGGYCSFSNHYYLKKFWTHLKCDATCEHA